MRRISVGTMLFGAAMLFGMVVPTKVSAAPLWGCEEGYKLQVEMADKTPKGVRCYKEAEWQYGAKPRCIGVVMVGSIEVAMQYSTDEQGNGDRCTGSEGPVSVSILPACQGGYDRLEQQGTDACRKRIPADAKPPIVPVS